MLNYRNLTGRLVLLAAVILALQSCGAYMHQPMQNREARFGEVTPTNQLLRELPEPKDKIVAAVYKFQDQTGQYQPSETGASWSTAVTQGGTSLLMRAMEDSEWFVPIERENIGNLLNERKLIRSSHLQYNPSGGGVNAVPPLLFAGVILEGGVISYDANVMTGGAGMRYFGTGAGGQYRQDRVTVCLRAISTNSGKVLKTVYTSKTILSQSMDGGVFKFVSFKRLLEVETGFSTTEPAEQAVTEAIEKAIQILVLEGIDEGLWEAKDDDKAQKAIKEIKREKLEMAVTDLHNRKAEKYRSKSSWTLNGIGSLYVGDFGRGTIKPGLEIGYQKHFSEWWSAGMTYGMSNLGMRHFFNTRAGYIDANVQYRMLPLDKYTPYLTGGLGLLFTENKEGDFSIKDKQQLKLNLGAGMEFMINQTLSFNVSGQYNYPFDDMMDNMIHGKFNDAYWQGKVGINYYFGKQF
jgi:curli production assembly/transport component CsgG